MSNQSLVLLLLSVAAGGALFLSWPPGSLQSGEAASVAGAPLLDGVTVREQVMIPELESLKAQGVRSIVSLRPDGESSDQPAAQVLGDAARAAGLTFAYVPVPMRGIPDDAVNGLRSVLATAPRPVVLYCKSGTRAARTWALAEASRAGGASADAITAAVRSAGKVVDDLKEQIAARIATRNAQFAAP